MRDFLTIGQIVNTHGIKGEVKIYPLTDDYNRFKKLKRVFLNGVETKIIWCKLQNDRVILKLEGLDTIEEAIKLKGIYIEVPREEAVRLKEGEYFVADIIGCSVQDEEGEYLGVISEVISTGSNDVYWIKGEKELLIPALKSVVLTIDMKERKITIKPLCQWME